MRTYNEAVANPEDLGLCAKAISANDALKIMKRTGKYDGYSNFGLKNGLRICQWLMEGRRIKDRPPSPTFTIRQMEAQNTLDQVSAIRNGAEILSGLAETMKRMDQLYCACEPALELRDEAKNSVPALIGWFEKLIEGLLHDEIRSIGEF